MSDKRNTRRMPLPATALVAVLVVASLGASGCILRRVPGGGLVTQTRQAQDFDRISFSGLADLTVDSGPDYRVELRGLEGVLDGVRTYVSGNTLHIDQRSGFPWRAGPVREFDVRVTMPRLRGVDHSGAGKVSLPAAQGDELTLELSGAGDLRAADIDVERLAVKISGAGAVFLSGRAEDARFELSGGGSFEAGGLETKRTTADVSGVGSASLWVTDSLDVDLSGAGSIRYWGDPRITQDVSGFGELVRMGDKPGDRNQDEGGTPDATRSPDSTAPPPAAGRSAAKGGAWGGCRDDARGWIGCEF